MRTIKERILLVLSDTPETSREIVLAIEGSISGPTANRLYPTVHSALESLAREGRARRCAPAGVRPALWAQVERALASQEEAVPQIVPEDWSGT